jgi:hypothetical protein
MFQKVIRKGLFALSAIFMLANMQQKKREGKRDNE